MRPGPPRARGPPWRPTGAVGWGPGWQMPAISCLACRHGGVLPPPPGRGWPRWRAGCAGTRQTSKPCGATRARRSGWGWPCCWWAAQCWSGRACTASRRVCRGIRAASWGTCWAHWPSNGWVLPARGWPASCWWWRVRRWCSVSPGAMWPRWWARACMRWWRRAAKNARSLPMWKWAGVPPASGKKWCRRSGKKPTSTTRPRC